jgi:hypothetical protein
MDPDQQRTTPQDDSASKTRVNALLALRSIRGTDPSSLPQLQTRIRDLAARCARAVDESFAQEIKGRGERRMPAAPAAPCALGIGKNAHE